MDFIDADQFSQDRIPANDADWLDAMIAKESAAAALEAPVTG